MLGFMFDDYCMSNDDRLFQMERFDVRSVFDSSDSESEEEQPDAPKLNLSDVGQDNGLPVINPLSFDEVSHQGLEMEGNKVRSLFCSTCLPLDSMVVREAPASWGKFYVVDDYVVRLPMGRDVLELIHPLDDVSGQKQLFLYICSEKPKPCVCIILIE